MRLTEMSSSPCHREGKGTTEIRGTVHQEENETYPRKCTSFHDICAKWEQREALIDAFEEMAINDAYLFAAEIV